MKRLFLILAATVLLSTVSIAEQPAQIEIEQALQIKLEAIFWETNYCEQRILTLKKLSEDIQKEIKQISEEKKRISQDELEEK